MKLKFLTCFFICVFASASLFAQKEVTPDIEGLKLHLSAYRDLDAATRALLNAGYAKVSWPIAKGMGSLKNAAYKAMLPDSSEKILEIIHSDDKRVFKVNLYLGFNAKKWGTFSDAQKASVLITAFKNIRDLINKEYGTSEKGQRKVWGNYKEEDYNTPATLLKGMEERALGFFANWGPFGNYPIELESYNSQYVVATVVDPEALSAYFASSKK